MPGWSKNADPSRDPSSGEREDDSARAAAEDFRREFLEHLQARAELLGIELREAGGLAARKGGLGIAAVLLAFFAYILLLVAGISLLGLWLASSWPETFKHSGWQVVAVVLGILHGLLALILFNKLKHRPSQPLFEYTRAEFHKDREWLQKKQSRKKNDASP